MKLTATMEQALISSAAYDFQTPAGASRSTELALVRRGLAEVVTGNYSYRKHGFNYNVYGGYYGIKLTSTGVELAKALVAARAGV